MVVTVTIHVKSSEYETKLRREELCQKILSRFSPLLSESTVNQRVLCLIDDEDFHLRKQGDNQTERGYRIDVRKVNLAYFIPSYFIDQVVHANTWPRLHQEYLCDQVVYLHGSTSETDIGLALTFAHELQHVVQSITAPVLFKMNDKLREQNQPWSHHFTAWWHFPVEIDARVVAKRVAEELYGSATIKQFLTERRDSRPLDVGDWEFVLSINTQKCYDPINDSELMLKRWNIAMPA